ncbi:hypothetical protein DK389_23505 [Methylobacterium durans]|uniref:Uncharacterized protein n=1 Tax=Methylobacterium durans TaxID=2202825 RepID=A0A2U8WCA0_9HYPH|nr:hypothetical protein DK389_23505 [Methylobacterium durans]
MVEPNRTALLNIGSQVAGPVGAGAIGGAAERRAFASKARIDGSKPCSAARNVRVATAPAPNQGVRARPERTTGTASENDRSVCGP